MSQADGELLVTRLATYLHSSTLFSEALLDTAVTSGHLNPIDVGPDAIDAQVRDLLVERSVFVTQRAAAMLQQRAS